MEGDKSKKVMSKRVIINRNLGVTESIKVWVELHGIHTKAGGLLLIFFAVH
jgi:hypothetical protein